MRAHGLPPLPRGAAGTAAPLLLDGGLATQLEAQGADLSDRLWSARLLVEEPDEIVAAHLAFFRAGARVATTASLPGHVRGLRRPRPGPRRRRGLLRRSVELADAGARHGRSRRASPGRCSSPRPSGRTAPCSPTAPSTAAGTAGPWRSWPTSTGSGSGSSRGPARTSSPWRRSRRSRRPRPSRRSWASCRAPRPGSASPAPTAATCASGAPIEEAVAAISDAPGVVAIGVNCTAPEHVEELIARIRAVSSLPIAVYPNSGEGWDAVARRWTGTGAGRVDGEAAVRWRSAGAHAHRRLLPREPVPGGRDGPRRSPIAADG